MIDYTMLASCFALSGAMVFYLIRLKRLENEVDKLAGLNLKVTEIIGGLSSATKSRFAEQENVIVKMVASQQAQEAVIKRLVERLE